MNVAFEEQPAPDLESPVDYHRQWQAYALRHAIALTLLCTWPFAALGFFYLSRYHLHQPVLALSIIVAWLAVACAAVFWAGEFRCPRCLRRYGALGHKRGWNLTRGLFDEVCSNCKLRKFELRTPRSPENCKPGARREGAGRKVTQPRKAGQATR